MVREHINALATWMARRFPVLRHAPVPMKRLIRGTIVGEHTSAGVGSGSSEPADDYGNRLAREQEIFAGQDEVHDLPPIYHYWSNTYLRPQLMQYGFSNPDEFFATYLQRTSEIHGGHSRFASVGAGNCDTEIRVAQILLDRGVSDFTLDCIDINTDMLKRGKTSAEEAGVSAHFQFQPSDFNSWQPAPRTYCAVMANQSLHHVVELERLFSNIESSLSTDGRFLTSDMIGRNGHMRWPEAMDVVHEFWRCLPESRKWNLQLKRFEDLYEYWDCSKEGFEGIRSQDVLPLLIETFDFELFVPYGNVIDPFIDRSFGWHFDPDSIEDREFIDRIHFRDHEEISSGRITPTHMIAVMRKRPYSGSCEHPEGLSPPFCVRDPFALRHRHLPL